MVDDLFMTINYKFFMSSNILCILDFDCFIIYIYSLNSIIHVLENKIMV